MYRREILMKLFHLKKSMLLSCAVLLVFLLPSIACSIGGITFGQNGATIEVSLTEDQVNTLFTNVQGVETNGVNRLLDQVTGVEMHDGYIRVLGTTNSSGQEVSGSFDVSVGAENDVLVVQIIAVNIPGIDMTDPRIIEANEELTEELSQSVTDTNGDVLFKEATVTDDELNLVLQVNIQ
jgi:hypothetical protein